ncbi:MAG: thioredoxin domain-containing protein [Lishizhenia sp.]
MYKHTNSLKEESSPYLLQHAHNPVNWVAWSKDAFETAKKENKLVLISIGYSACHWCHVMEHESFEDGEVAKIMNENFVCIKVDREERPDVDQVYMTAVQLMTQRGGWPLNCFTLHDGSPIYGGTYFPKDQWINVLKSLAHTFENDKDKVVEYANNLTKGIQQSELVDTPTEINPVDKEKINELVLRWSKTFDMRDGGPTRAPKFMLPNNFDFLMRYADYSNDQKVEEYVELSLDKMAMGGIYDQIGGGFARYSTDMLWKVPHFEKMLYDNGQLVSLYSQAYKKYKKPLYKEIVYQTLAWVEREMTTKEGAFYAALDADSEGEEGKFYVWKKEELEELLQEDYAWVKDYYNINGKGFWEDENYILLRNKTDKTFAKEKGFTSEELRKKVDKVNQILLDERNHRIKPGLDDKCLTSWNAMMLKGYADAYLAFGEEAFLQAALKNAKWIKTKQLKADGSLWHTYKDGKSTVNGFLEDYAHTIDAFTHLYEANFDIEWLNLAKKLTEYSVEHFQNDNSKMFYFTNSDSELIARKMEINDNVIPASNSVMANNLYILGTYFDNENWKKNAIQMLANVYDGMETYGSGYSNWAILSMNFIQPVFEIAIVGKVAIEKNLEMHQNYIPNALFMGGKSDTGLALLEGKLVEGETRIYVCENKACQLPTSEVNVALKLIK